MQGSVYNLGSGPDKIPMVIRRDLGRMGPVSKTKKYTLICRECKAQFQSADHEARICKTCISKERQRAVPKGPRPVDEQIK